MGLWDRHRDVFVVNWHLGFTAFGGPPVQFQTFHKMFVEELGWIDEPLYQQIFAISQAFPGSASVKMIFTINAVHSGYMGGFIAFILFCLPGAIGMYGLAAGISRVGTTLPIPVYALLSGLNAATVGIIALAAVRLAERAITDRITRALVYLGGIIGMLYTALWYYPVIMVGAGLTTLIWDLRWLPRIGASLKKCWPKRNKTIAKKEPVEDLEKCQHEPSGEEDTPSTPSARPLPSTPPSPSQNQTSPSPPKAQDDDDDKQALDPFPSMSWKTGTTILLLFLLTFITSLTLRTILHSPPRDFSLFANLYLAGTIIFGGGPVIIPLLREYVVTQGWVSARDFLLGLAIIQAFPGPNYNFAVYLGTLAVAGTSSPGFVGALIAFVAVHAPGLIVVTGFMGLWRVLRAQKWFLAVLRGINASAVGLVYTAVYKLWQIGCLSREVQAGSPLGTEPWLVAVTVTAYVGVAWFRMNPPTAILLGGAMGMVRYAFLLVCK